MLLRLVYQSIIVFMDLTNALEVGIYQSIIVGVG